MFNGLINVSMLSRGALQLAPIFIAGLLTGNPIWFRVEIVAISAFIAAERSRLAPLALFIVSFVGLAVSLFPDFVPGKLGIVEAASDSRTLAFMLAGIGLIFPVMIGYNLYQYYIFRGKVVGEASAGD